jgi:hypothetical protein
VISDEYAEIHAQLVDALAEALDYCARSGWNLPEVLRMALEQLAADRGGSWQLIKHRPGSWEAVHVSALAAGWEWTPARPAAN